MALYFVDGDNMPGMKTVFIENLQENDEVYVLYAKGNTYYASEKNRTALINSTRAKVTVEAVFSDKDAVDFAIATKAGIAAANAKGEPIFLISSDHHFECIAKAIQWMVPEMNGKVMCCETIRDAFVSDPANITDSNILHKLFCSEFGHETGVKLYARCKELFWERFEEEERKKKLMMEQQARKEEKERQRIEQERLAKEELLAKQKEEELRAKQKEEAEKRTGLFLRLFSRKALRK